jgi:hypothetical protein
MVQYPQMMPRRPSAETHAIGENTDQRSESRIEPIRQWLMLRQSRQHPGESNSCVHSPLGPLVHQRVLSRPLSYGVCVESSGRSSINSHLQATTANRCTLREQPIAFSSLGPRQTAAFLARPDDVARIPVLLNSANSDANSKYCRVIRGQKCWRSQGKGYAAGYKAWNVNIGSLSAVADDHGTCNPGEQHGLELAQIAPLERA